MSQPAAFLHRHPALDPLGPAMREFASNSVEIDQSFHAAIIAAAPSTPRP